MNRCAISYYHASHQITRHRITSQIIPMILGSLCISPMCGSNNSSITALWAANN